MQKVCVVIPCYNEQHRLPTAEFGRYLEENDACDFCFVNDGSQDGTILLLYQLQERYRPRITVINLKENCGKAEAVRQGFLASLSPKKYAYIGYFDADLATPLTEIANFLQFANTDKHLLIFGSRVKRMGAVITRSAKRHYLGRVFSTVASLILDLPIYDTQCGAKLIHSTVASQIFDQPFLSRWLFDIEIFARFSGLSGYQPSHTMMEVPLNCWVEKGDSRLGWTYLWKVPFELMRIYRRYRVSKTAVTPSVVIPVIER